MKEKQRCFSSASPSLSDTELLRSLMTTEVIGFGGNVRPK